MLMAAPRRHPYAGVGLPIGLMPVHQQLNHPGLMVQQQQLGPPQPPQQSMLRQQSPPMYGQSRMDCHSPPVSRTYQYKKVTKPLLERKRRARINRCLDELKELMVGALEAEGENVSKLEKADILELTVRHLQRITRPRDAVEDASRFQAGFTQCATEACQFLLALPGLDAHVGSRLVAHLSQMVNGLSTATAAAAASNNTSPLAASPAHVNHPENQPQRVSPPASPSTTPLPSVSATPPRSVESPRNIDSRLVESSRNIESRNLELSRSIDLGNIESPRGLESSRNADLRFIDSSRNADTRNIEIRNAESSRYIKNLKIDVKKEEDDCDEESPVNYTNEALRLKEHEREYDLESPSKIISQCLDDKGPMWRPW